MFVTDISEAVVTSLNAEATALVVESWTPERGLQRIERAERDLPAADPGTRSRTRDDGGGSLCRTRWGGRVAVGEAPR